jgi:hypothetical protein
VHSAQGLFYTHRTSIRRRYHGALSTRPRTLLCRSLPSLYRSPRGLFCLLSPVGSREGGRGAIPGSLPIRHVTSIWPHTPRVGPPVALHTAQEQQPKVDRRATRRVFKLSRRPDWPNTRLWWGALPRRLGRCPQSRCYDAPVPTDLRRDVDESGPRVRHGRAVSDGPCQACWRPSSVRFAFAFAK